MPRINMTPKIPGAAFGYNTTKPALPRMQPKESASWRSGRPELEEPSNVKEPFGKDLVSRLGGLKGSPGDKAWRGLYKGAFEDNRYKND